MTRTRTISAIVIIVALGLIAGTGLGASSAVSGDSDQVTGPTAQPAPLTTGTMDIRNHTDNRQPLEIVEWAVSRYELAGLALPSSEIHFHPFEPSMAECNGRSGLHLATVAENEVAHAIDMCAVGVPSRRWLMVHEFAHAWTYYNVSPDERAAFAAARGLDAWSDKDHAWHDRATEHAAEIITWGLSERCAPREMLIGEDPASLVAAFESLTGSRPLCAAEPQGSRVTSTPVM